LSASHHGSEPWPRTFDSFRLNQLTGWGCWHPRRALTPFTQVRFLTREPISVGGPAARAVQALEIAKASRGAKSFSSAATRVVIYAYRAACVRTPWDGNVRGCAEAAVAGSSGRKRNSGLTASGVERKATLDTGRPGTKNLRQERVRICAPYLCCSQSR